MACQNKTLINKIKGNKILPNLHCFCFSFHFSAHTWASFLALYFWNKLSQNWRLKKCSIFFFAFYKSTSLKVLWSSDWTSWWLRLQALNTLLRQDSHNWGKQKLSGKCCMELLRRKVVIENICNLETHLWSWLNIQVYLWHINRVILNSWINWCIHIRFTQDVNMKSWIVRIVNVLVDNLNKVFPWFWIFASFWVIF